MDVQFTPRHAHAAARPMPHPAVVPAPSSAASGGPGPRHSTTGSASYPPPVWGGWQSQAGGGSATSVSQGAAAAKTIYTSSTLGGRLTAGSTYGNVLPAVAPGQPAAVPAPGTVSLNLPLRAQQYPAIQQGGPLPPTHRIRCLRTPPLGCKPAAYHGRFVVHKIQTA